MNPETREWMQQTLHAAKMGEATEEDISILQQHLLTDSEARMLYLKENHLDCMLESGDVAELKITPLRKRLRPAQILTPLFSAAVAAALTLLIVLQWDSPREEAAVPEPAVASIDSSLNAKFSNLSGSQHHLEKGTFGLQEGIAKLKFLNGAEVIFDGHCDFQIISENHLHLEQGRIWAYCPPEAYGFTISTPGDKQIVDLGTEFGVFVRDSGTTELHVFDGLVEVREKGQQAAPVFADNAVFWQRQGEIMDLDYSNEEAFITGENLHSRRLEQYTNNLKSREDLLLYYDFSTTETQPNLALYARKNTNGTPQRIHTSEGRNAHFKAAHLSSEGSSIDFDLDTKLRSCTTNVWVKVNSIPKARSTLINSYGWKKNGVHLQITEDLAIESSLYGGDVIQSNAGVIIPHQWHMITTTWDLDAKEAKVYCDGVQLYTSNPYLEENFIRWSASHIHFGTASLGYWKHQGDLEKSNRQLTGALDEVLIFDLVLTSEEVARLYFEGKP